MPDQEIKVEQLSEKEFWVGNNYTCLIENNTIYVIAKGIQTHKLAFVQSKICHQLAQQVNGKVNYLIDLNKSGKNSPEARKQWTRLSEEENTDKVALYGVHPVARVLASFVMGVSKKKDMLFFACKEDAITWLKS